MIRSAIPVLLITALSACAARNATPANPLEGRTIVVDAGHGGTAATDAYRVGAGGEREEWINLRVALLLRDMLEQRGARVLMTRERDTAVALQARAELAVESQADAFVSLHHNATADRDVNAPVVYYHGYASRNEAGVRLARLVAEQLNRKLFEGDVDPVVVSDHVIFPGSGTAVLRQSWGIPGVLGEASFFTNVDEERRLRDVAHNRREAEAYVLALEAFFGEPVPPLPSRLPETPLARFDVAQEAERMQGAARLWREHYLEARRLLAQRDGDRARALELLTASVRLFPDSPVAADAHRLRADILESRGDGTEAAEVRRRVREFHAGVKANPNGS